MKPNKIIAAIVLLMLPMIAGAQVLKGSYFLDNSVNRHKMNPAFAPRANYFQLCVLGNTGFGAYSNLSLPTLTYPVDGKLGTFLHPSVSVQQFQRDLPKHLHMDSEVNTTLLSFGWFTKNKAFWNFTLDTRIMADVDLPSDLFVFMKKGAGTNGERYNIGNVNAYGTVNMHASLGYSREIISGLRAGIKLRAILPMAYVGLNLEEMSLSTSTESWKINTEGYLHAAAQGTEFNNSLDDGDLPVIFDPMKMLKNKILAGWGYSLDLGAEYRLEIGSIVDGLTFSAAVTDLGQVFYKKDCVSALQTKGEVEWTGIQNMTMENMAALEDSFNEFFESLDNLANLSEIENPGNLVRSAMPRFYLGVEYPFLKRTMSVGLLYSSRLSHSYARHELTASYNLKPCRWFALGLNYSFLNTTRTMGAMLELTPKVGPTFYIGCDYFPLEFAKVDLLGEVPDMLSSLGMDSYLIPTSSRFNFNFGFAFNLGSKYVNPKKDKKK